MPSGKAPLKEIIDEHLHREGFSPEWLEVEVEDRVAEGGRRAIAGHDIAGASGGFIDLKDGGRVPFHRVRNSSRRERSSTSGKPKPSRPPPRQTPPGQRQSSR